MLKHLDMSLELLSKYAIYPFYISGEVFKV